MEEIETFFKQYGYKENRLILNECEVIKDLKRFVSTHIKVLKCNPGNIAYKPYYDRLNKVYNKLK